MRGSTSRDTSRRPRLRPAKPGADPHASALADVARQLDRLERGDGGGELRLPDGIALPVTHLDKPYFPADGITKGDVMRFYVRVAPVLLRAIADRPLVLVRYPNGIAGPSFHQHEPAESTPAGVLVTRIVEASGDEERRLVGADPDGALGEALATMLYTVQLGAIPVNVWHSRVGRLEHPDYAVLDLDPDKKAGFAGVVTVAKLVHAALERRGLRALLKTSGSRGIHMLIPLPDRATYADSAALAEEVATDVATANPTVATVERGLEARRRGTVYVDHMQNAAGKTLVAVFSVRAKRGATVSTPISWRQVQRTLAPGRYTIAAVTRQRASLMKRWTTSLG